jgi:rod shape determining protein RodA
MLDWRYYRERMFKGFHWPLFQIVVFLSVLGLMVISSASHGIHGNFAVKQLTWLGIAVLALFIVVWAGYRTFLNYAYAMYVLSILLLLTVMFLGAIRMGAQRWIHFGSFAFQPSEFAKVATILTLAQYLGERARNRYQTKRFLVAFLIVVFPMLLILEQPDLGTGMIFLPIFFCILFLWGVKLRYFITTLLLGSVSLPFFWMILKEYQKRRLLVFLNPNVDPLGAGYTVIQSKIAVGSGELLGKGFLHGTQNKLNFLPEHHTDFIFCVLAEEWGFLGSLCLILLFALLFMKMIQVVHRTNDTRARLIAAGIIAMIFFQIGRARVGKEC